MDAAKQSLSEIKQEMAKTIDLFNVEVFGKRNFDAIDQIYTTDARIMPPGRLMVSGRQEIKGFWFDIIRSYNAKSTARESLDIMPGGEGVVEVGRSVITAEPAGQPEVQVDIKYVVFWKQEDGLWRWHVHIWNLSW
jgi:ketosteroid isomerase-like protein